MKVYEGPGVIAHMAGATVLPVRIDGAQYSLFSRHARQAAPSWFPKITITVLPPVKFDGAGRLEGPRTARSLADGSTTS